MPQQRIHRYLRHGTLPQLAVFEASARHLSFTRAAEELHLAQPTVSAQIHKLAETVGAPLFEQIGKRIFLTETGRETLTHCREILGTFERLDDSLAGMRGLASGHLRVAAASASQHIAARMIAGFGVLHPGITVALHIHNHRDVYARVAGNEDDLSIVANPASGADLLRQAILAEPLVVVAGAASRWAARSHLTLSALAGEPLLMREAGSRTRELVTALFARHDVEFRTRVELASNEAVREAVLAGFGVGVLPVSAARDLPLAVLDVEGFPLDQYWHFVYPAGKSLSRAARALLDHGRAFGPDALGARSTSRARAHHPLRTSADDGRTGIGGAPR